MTLVPDLALNNGVAIPQLGFGVFRVMPDDTAKVVQTALEAGYRSIDTATVYQNEEGVGEALRSSGLRRDELFVTTKLWNADQGYDAALRAFDTSMAKLGLDYLDLYLIHWPMPARATYVQTWQALETLYDDSRIRAIGVSNFQVPHLQRLLDETNIVPSVNQVELHPHLQQAELRAFHAEHDITTEAWSPLAKGTLLKDETITGLASKYAKTPAQIVLRWHLQLGNVVIPKSATPSRIRENLEVFDFELSDDDLTTIAELDNGTRTGAHPDSVNQG